MKAFIALLLLPLAALSQTLAVTPKTGRGVVDHTITYTVPAGATCTLAGGALTGTVTTSGSKLLSGVTAPSTTYSITCPAAPGNAVLTWTRPTQNTDGSTLTDLSGYKVYWGTNTNSLNNSVSVPGATTLTTTINALTPATWFFAVASVSAAAGEGNKSNQASKVITGTAGGAASDTATITPTALPPATPVVTEVFAFEQRKFLWLKYAALVGRIELGSACGAQVTGNYYSVNRAQVQLYRSSGYRGGALMAKCG